MPRVPCAAAAAAAAAVDRNSYSGGDCASLNLTNLYKKFIKDEEPPKAFFDALGANRDYNVDLIPKFIMAGGNLVKLLVATDVTRYLNFKSIGGCYVFKKGAGLGKVPATKEEAMSSNLLSILQKNYLRIMLQALDAYKVEDPKTWKGGHDWRKMTSRGASSARSRCCCCCCGCAIAVFGARRPRAACFLSPLPAHSPPAHCALSATHRAVQVHVVRQ